MQTPELPCFPLLCVTLLRSWCIRLICLAVQEAIAPLKAARSFTKARDCPPDQQVLQHEMLAVQALIRERLPQALADPDNRMQTASGMAIAVIVKYEFPDGWPQLLPSLVQAITARRSSSEGAHQLERHGDLPNAVAGCW